MGHSDSDSRRFPLQWHLVLLVGGALVPVIVFAAILVVRQFEGERLKAVARVVQLTEMMQAELTRKLSATIETLEAISMSERFDRGDTAGVLRLLKRINHARPTWHAAFVTDPTGRALVSTDASAESKLLSSAGEVDFHRDSARRSVISSLVPDESGKRWYFTVRVPVRRGDTVLYTLAAVLHSGAVSDLVMHTLEHDEWTRTIVDARSRVVARTRAPESWVGKIGTASYRKTTREATSGITEETALEGVSVYMAFRREPLSDWTVSIAAPQSAVAGAANASIYLVVALGLFLLAVSVSGAWLLSRHLRRNINNAIDAARALSLGRMPDIPATSVAESAELFDALRQSGRLLALRERERDEHLARAHAARTIAEEASRAKDEFLATLGHELRNPLAPIVLAIEMLKEGSDPDNPALAVIDRQMAHLCRLIDDLLDVSRIARDKVALENKVADLRTIVSNAVEISRPIIAQRNHELRVAPVEHPVLLKCDAVRLAQVFQNILTNAAKYTHPGGIIQLSWEFSESFVEVAISDNGDGISSDLLPHVFDLFVQAHRTFDRPQGGLGIGLALVRSLVQMHGGDVRAESDGPGRGSRFTVRLPLFSTPNGQKSDDAMCDPALLRKVQLSLAMRVPLKVLIVDDNTDAATMMDEFLTRHGMTAVAVGDALSAIDALGSYHADAAILDIGLPAMDGCELATTIRERLGDRAPALLAVSGFGQPGDVERSRRAGFRRHFVKPVDPLEILQELATIAGERSVAGSSLEDPSTAEVGGRSGTAV